MYALNNETMLLKRPKKHQNCPEVVSLSGVVVQAQGGTYISSNLEQMSRFPREKYRDNSH
jgi:uncharacterized sporulation protein YeaH/YhbH (DUF444 family)